MDGLGMMKTRWKIHNKISECCVRLVLSGRAAFSHAPEYAPVDENFGAQHFDSDADAEANIELADSGGGTH
jgi:hypothetical protein